MIDCFLCVVKMWMPVDDVLQKYGCQWMICCRNVDASGSCVVKVWMPVDDTLWKCGCQWMICCGNVDASG